MRLWSLHPSILDRAALVACWREGLLAQRVLTGTTRGYTKHPQLERFRGTAEPLDAVGHYLMSLRAEAVRRGYSFDATRVMRPDAAAPGILVTTGQLAFELEHLRLKVGVRDPDWLPRLPTLAAASPSLVEVPGEVESWERAAPAP